MDSIRDSCDVSKVSSSESVTRSSIELSWGQLKTNLYRKNFFGGLEFWLSKITFVYLFARMVVHIWRIYWRIRGGEAELH